jgi:hypothetical protein
MSDSRTVLWDDKYIEKRWGKRPGFMSDLRARGQGPRFLRLSSRCVRYKPASVEAYENQQEFESIAASLASDFRAPAAEDEKSASEKSRFMVTTGNRQKI